MLTTILAPWKTSPLSKCKTHIVEQHLHNNIMLRSSLSRNTHFVTNDIRSCEGLCTMILIDYPRYIYLLLMQKLCWWEVNLIYDSCHTMWYTKQSPLVYRSIRGFTDIVNLEIIFTFFQNDWMNEEITCCYSNNKWRKVYARNLKQRQHWELIKCFL